MAGDAIVVQQAQAIAEAARYYYDAEWYIEHNKKKPLVKIEDLCEKKEKWERSLEKYKEQRKTRSNIPIQTHKDQEVLSQTEEQWRIEGDQLREMENEMIHQGAGYRGLKKLYEIQTHGQDKDDPTIGGAAKDQEC